MSIKDQLTAKHVEFVSMEDVLLRLAAAEEITFEAVADWLYQRVDTLPNPIRHDALTLKQEPVDAEHVAKMLDSVVFYSCIGLIHDMPAGEEERDENGKVIMPYIAEYQEVGWPLKEFSAWLKKNGVDPAPLSRADAPESAGHANMSGSLENAASAPGLQPKKANRVVAEFTGYADDVLMSIADVQAVTGLSRATVNRRCKEGILTKIGTGGQAVRIRVGDVRKMLAG